MVSPEDSEHQEDEIRDVIAAIDNHAGPQSLIVLAVVSKEVILKAKSQCSNASGESERPCYISMLLSMNTDSRQQTSRLRRKKTFRQQSAL